MHTCGSGNDIADSNAFANVLLFIPVSVAVTTCLLLQRRCHNTHSHFPRVATMGVLGVRNKRTTGVASTRIASLAGPKSRSGGLRAQIESAI